MLEELYSLALDTANEDYMIFALKSLKKLHSYYGLVSQLRNDDFRLSRLKLVTNDAVNLAKSTKSPLNDNLVDDVKPLDKEQKLDAILLSSQVKEFNKESVKPKVVPKKRFKFSNIVCKLN